MGGIAVSRLSSGPGRPALPMPQDRMTPRVPADAAVAVHRLRVPAAAVRGPLVRDGVLFHIDVRHQHLAAVVEGRTRVVLPSVPADAVLCAVGDELRIAYPVPGGFGGVGFHVREGLSTCPVPRSFPPVLWAPLQAAAAPVGVPAGAVREHTQIRMETGGLALELSLPAAPADSGPLLRPGDRGAIWPVRRILLEPAGEGGCLVTERLPGLVSGAAPW